MAEFPDRETHNAFGINFNLGGGLYAYLGPLEGLGAKHHRLDVCLADSHDSCVRGS